MANPRAQTLQQRFGFVDKDLTSYGHDIIMTWLDDYCRQTFIPWAIDVLQKECDEMAYHEEDLTKIPPKIDTETEIKWEYVISVNKYVVGFIDMAVIINVPYLRHTDAYPAETWWQFHSRTFCFEVKTKIGSVGELLRQINMYREYVKWQFYVVAPDSQYKKQLQSQNVGFIHYPGKTNLWMD